MHHIVQKRHAEVKVGHKKVVADPAAIAEVAVAHHVEVAVAHHVVVAVGHHVEVAVAQ